MLYGNYCLSTSLPIPKLLSQIVADFCMFWRRKQAIAAPVMPAPTTKTLSAIAFNMTDYISITEFSFLRTNFVGPFHITGV